MRLALLRSSRVFGAVLIAAIAGCGGSSGGSTTPSGAVAIQPTPNAARDIDATALTVDATAQTAVAVITFAASAQPGATLEIGDLDIDSVRVGPSSTGADLPWADRGDRLDLGLPASNQTAVVTVRYRYRLHGNFDGASNSNSNSGQSTYLWPYFCSNLFPCHSQPADGVDYTLEVRNPPSGQRVIAAVVPLNAAPAYQLAWAIGNYVDVDLGRSRAGTQLVASYLPGDGDAMRSGTEHLRAAFEWAEATLGAYRFGPVAGPVSVQWGVVGSGSSHTGIEHHPRWHINSTALHSAETQVHEALHGWFGNGVRMGCWEDFVLSEGTTTYLTGRALEVVAPEVGARVWAGYVAQLRGVGGAQPVWPNSCNQIDVVKSGLYSRAAYLRGAFFYRALALKLGAPVLDHALARFYRQHAGRAAGMQDMLEVIQADTGYDPAECAQRWLRSNAVPALGPC